MTTIMIGKALATVTENEILTSGMINAKIKFVFSDDWYPALSKTAIFTAGDVTKVVLDSYWENNVCSIPQECLAKSDEILMVGIYGADNANVVAIPTVWATVGKIRKGYEGYEDVSTGTLPIWAQVQSAAAQSATAAKNAQDAAEAAQSKAETAQGKAESAQSAAESAAVSASGSASAAASSASAAAASETASAQSAQTATEKASVAQAAAQTAQSAKADAESAKAAAQAAQIKAEAANTSAQTAKADAEAANTSAQSAKADAESAKSAAARSAQSAAASAQSAQASGKLSESWAVGGTGTRTGEDTNNAKYWAMAAQGAAGGASIAMRVDGGFIQYSTDNGKTWVNLIAEADFKGDKGDKGADGTDGITPHIGDNGNWYIGSTDTGNPSRGATGSQGPAGAPGKDGAGMDITGATVGQIAKIAAVDENGVPTAWSPVDMPAGVPSVTAADNGKFLRVVSGAWAASEISSANGVSF